MAYYVISQRKQCSCTNKQDSRCGKIVFRLCVVFVVCFVLFCVWWNNIIDRFCEIVAADAQSRLTMYANSGVSQQLAIVSGGQFVSVQRNASGQVVSVRADHAAINAFCLTSSVYLQQNLQQKCGEFSIPIGTVSGFVLLANVGPCLKAQFDGSPKVSCDVQSQFISAGVNQTMHRVFANVSLCVDVHVPWRQFSVQVDVPVLLSENLIVGNVPSVYLQH